MEYYKNITTFEELYNTCTEQSPTIWQTAMEHEVDAAEISVEEFRAIVKKSLDAMKEAIRTGIKSREMSISGMWMERAKSN